MAGSGVAQRSWPELMVGIVTGLLVANQVGVDGGGAVLAGLLGAFVAYLIGCALFPLRLCWWCGGKAMLGDGRGNLRERPCFRCHRERIIRRWGARMIGARGRRS